MPPTLRFSGMTLWARSAENLREVRYRMLLYHILELLCKYVIFFLQF